MSKPNFAKVDFKDLPPGTVRRAAKDSFVRVSTGKNLVRWLTLTLVEQDIPLSRGFAPGAQVRVAEAVLSQPGYEGRRVLKLTPDQNGSFTLRSAARGATKSLILRLGSRGWFPAEDLDGRSVETHYEDNGRSSSVIYVMLPMEFDAEVAVKDNSSEEAQEEEEPGESGTPETVDPPEASEPSTDEPPVAPEPPVAEQTPPVPEAKEPVQPPPANEDRDPPKRHTASKPATKPTASNNRADDDEQVEILRKATAPDRKNRMINFAAAMGAAAARGPVTRPRAQLPHLGEYETLKTTGDLQFKTLNVSLPVKDRVHRRLLALIVDSQNRGKKIGLTELHRQRFIGDEMGKLKSSLEDTKNLLMGLADITNRKGLVLVNDVNEFYFRPAVMA